MIVSHIGRIFRINKVVRLCVLYLAVFFSITFIIFILLVDLRPKAHLISNLRNNRVKTVECLPYDVRDRKDKCVGELGRLNTGDSSLKALFEIV